jgi:hypothetical protein
MIFSFSADGSRWSSATVMFHSYSSMPYPSTSAPDPRSHILPTIDGTCLPASGAAPDGAHRFALSLPRPYPRAWFSLFTTPPRPLDAQLGYFSPRFSFHPSAFSFSQWPRTLSVLSSVVLLKP